MDTAVVSDLPLYLGRDITGSAYYFLVKCNDGTARFLAHSTGRIGWCLSSRMSSFLDIRNQPPQEVIDETWAFLSNGKEVSGVVGQSDLGIHFGSGRQSSDDRRTRNPSESVSIEGGRSSAIPDILGESRSQHVETAPVKRRGRPPGSKNKPKPQSE